VPAPYFAEGLADVGNRLFQLTWQHGLVFVYDRATLGRVGELRYTGEGWGLCHDGAAFVMSNGSDTLTLRDTRTFAVTRSVRVTRDGSPVSQLNELECVGKDVYANVWMTDTIVRIDPSNGRVTATIDAAGLLSPMERAGVDVLNGIAYDPADGTLPHHRQALAARVPGPLRPRTPIARTRTRYKNKGPAAQTRHRASEPVEPQFNRSVDQ
jgi:glutaminyl-peptide cyclotransferase